MQAPLLLQVNSVRLQTPQWLSSMASGQSTTPLQRFPEGWQLPSLQRNAHSRGVQRTGLMRNRSSFGVKIVRTNCSGFAALRLPLNLRQQ